MQNVTVMTNKDSLLLQLGLNSFLFILFSLLHFSFFKFFFTSFTSDLPLIIYWRLIQYALAQVFLILLVSLLALILSKGMIKTFHVNKNNHLLVNLIVFALLQCFFISLNAYFFPESLVTKLIISPLPSSVSSALLYLSGFLTLCLLTFSLYNLTKRSYLYFSLTVLAIALLYYSLPPKLNNPSKTFKSTQSLVLIGIDSLKIEKINQQNTPTLYNEIKKSQRFINAITPIARTYPAWLSLLSGLSPSNHGHRFNLMSDQDIRELPLLSKELKKKGYHTIFASDERRFNSINKSHGFDTIIGPKTDAFDFIITNFDDYPLSNLFSLLPKSQLIFPYRYLNRAHWQYYSPSSFDNSLLSHLYTNVDKPFFLAVHYTLTHWPYRHRTQIPNSNKQDEITYQQKTYTEALKNTDSQIKKLIHYLKQLTPSPLIVILSDHGETILEEDSRPIKQELYQGSKPSLLLKELTKQGNFKANTSLGHGTDLLSPKQSEVLLAFVNVAGVPPIYREYNEAVSLIDVEKTIASLLKIPSVNGDGRDLSPLIYQKKDKLDRHDLFLESGLTTLPLTKEAKLNLSSIHRISKLYYQISTKTGKVFLRKDKLTELLAQKQFALKRNNTLYVLYPVTDCTLPITLDLTSLKWSENLDSTFAKQKDSANAFAHLIKNINLKRKIVDKNHICT